MRGPAASHRGDPDDPRNGWRDRSSADYQAGEPSTGEPRFGDAPGAGRDRAAGADAERDSGSRSADGRDASDDSSADQTGVPVGSSDVPTPPNAAASATGDATAAKSAVPARRRPERAHTSPLDANDAAAVD